MVENSVGQEFRQGRVVSRLHDIRAQAGKTGRPGSEVIWRLLHSLLSELEWFKGWAQQSLLPPVPINGLFIWPGLPYSMAASGRLNFSQRAQSLQSECANSSRWTPHPLSWPSLGNHECHFLLYFQVTSLPNSREAAYTLPLVGETSKNLQVFLELTEEKKNVSEEIRGERVIEAILLTGEVGEK